MREEVWRAVDSYEWNSKRSKDFVLGTAQVPARIPRSRSSDGVRGRVGGEGRCKIHGALLCNARSAVCKPSGLTSSSCHHGLLDDLTLDLLDHGSDCCAHLKHVLDFEAGLSRIGQPIVDGAVLRGEVQYMMSEGEVEVPCKSY